MALSTTIFSLKIVKTGRHVSQLPPGAKCADMLVLEHG